MLLGIAIFIGCLVAVFVMIALHECGHFIAGLGAGIPVDQMKIRFMVFPQYVALRDGDDWLSPVGDSQRYIARSMAMIKGKKRAIAYVSGGLLAQTAVFAAFVLVCRSMAVHRLWVTPVACALVALPILYLLADLFATKRANHPCGDFSGLWKISPLASVWVTAIVICSHLGLLFYALKSA